MLPTKPMELTKLFRKAIQYHYPVLKNTWLIILFMVIVKDYYIYLGGFPENDWLRTTLQIISIALIVYLWSASFLVTNQAIHEQSIKLSDSFQQTLHKLPYIYLVVIAYVLLGIILHFFSILMAHGLHSLGINKVSAEQLSFVFFLSLPFMVILVSTLFTIPLLILEDASLFFALQESIRLVGFKNWLRSFGIYFFGVAILLLVAPDTLHGHLLATYHLNAPYDFIVFVVTLPVFNNLLILLLHDLRLKKALY